MLRADLRSLTQLGFLLPSTTLIQATVEHGRLSVGVLWFGIVSQVVVNLGAIYTLVDIQSASLYRSTISAFAVLSCALGGIGINATLSFHDTKFQMLSAAWIIMVILDLVWIVYFTADQGSAIRRTLHGPEDVYEYDDKPPTNARALEDESFAPMHPTLSGQHQYTSVMPASPPRGGGPIAASSTKTPSVATATDNDDFKPPNPPFGFGTVNTTDMGSQFSRLTQPISNDMGTSILSGSGTGGDSESGLSSEVSYTARARARFDYSPPPQATTGELSVNPELDQLSLRKGDILEVKTLDKKWWPARTQDGRQGIAPSNYLEIIREEPPTRLRRKLRK
ncbi:hypothetical protein PM082_016696 [Marasmius tenuissimus]|nr:hypothetical protein PM082_016696 [Marasmius tenuissimus]